MRFMDCKGVFIHEGRYVRLYIHMHTGVSTFNVNNSKTKNFQCLQTALYLFALKFIQSVVINVEWSCVVSFYTSFYYCPSHESRKHLFKVGKIGEHTQLFHNLFVIMLTDKIVIAVTFF